METSTDTENWEPAIADNIVGGEQQGSLITVGNIGDPVSVTLTADALDGNRRFYRVRSE